MLQGLPHRLLLAVYPRVSPAHKGKQPPVRNLTGARGRESEPEQPGGRNMNRGAWLPLPKTWCAAPPYRQQPQVRCSLQRHLLTTWLGQQRSLANNNPVQTQLCQLPVTGNPKYSIVSAISNSANGQGAAQLDAPWRSSSSFFFFLSFSSQLFARPSLLPDS